MRYPVAKTASGLRALVNQPALILADEPTAALDKSPVAMSSCSCSSLLKARLQFDRDPR